MLLWQDYTGPITIPLDRVKDVWIKYKIDNKYVIIPPAGRLLVDIVARKPEKSDFSEISVYIDFDETAVIKEYKIGNSQWMPYTGEFVVTENCVIQARAKKVETIYNEDGSILKVRNVAGRDLLYIGSFENEETDLEPPIITRLPGTGLEKARVKVTYPQHAERKVYKINYAEEKLYESEIIVESYGTHIKAYYYDANNKRSKASYIRINDTTKGDLPEEPGFEEWLPPYKPGDPPPVKPESEFPPPDIVITPNTALAEEVIVTVENTPNAEKIYVKLGRYGQYELYDTPITVKDNMEIYAYYITYMGDISDLGFGRVTNIKKPNRPYVKINAEPYPYTWSYGQSRVNVSINYVDADIMEYSEDGIIYKQYINPFQITENKTIYARGINKYGMTETTLNITNIGMLKAPQKEKDLFISITVDPDPKTSTKRYNKAKVTIDYDKNAVEKYYKINSSGELRPYTGEFELTKNCTLYAYAKGENASGKSVKRIDNLSSGIAEPIITTEPSSKHQSNLVTVNIEYDKYAKLKKYSIDGGNLIDYTEPFEIRKNDTVIYAYNQNDLNEIAESYYTISNIASDGKYFFLDKGEYFILKLNYPRGAKNKQYKWKEEGEWTDYKSAGILLIKPEYKDKLFKNGQLVKVLDENNRLITFKGDYYFVDVPINEIFENVFMKWNREAAASPKITITPTTPAIRVKVNIAYDSSLVKRQYKVLNPDETVQTDWREYNDEIIIDRNNSIILAKGMDELGVWTLESKKKITNIDEKPPVIKLTADLETQAQRVRINVSVTDDTGVNKVKWAEGIHGESYFISSGTEIRNNSFVYAESNGYYTFYAEDMVGNTQVYTLNITNIDTEPPDINISINPNNILVTEAEVTIDYKDSTLKKYKIGEKNKNWSDYRNPFIISSYTILANKWQNEDGTVTIYARGRDEAKNEVIIEKVVDNLDLDIPKTPIIQTNSAYSTLYEYGIEIDTTVNITYDLRPGIENYYSIDNGDNWIEYTGPIQKGNGTVVAKSIKRSSGLEVITSTKIVMSDDAIKPEAYDKNERTYISEDQTYILVDKSMQNKNIRVRWSGGSYNGNFRVAYLIFMDQLKNEIGRVQSTKGSDVNEGIYTVPVGTVWIQYTSEVIGKKHGKLYEIEPSNEPTFDITNGYILLSFDEEMSEKEPYQMIGINYFQTSVQKLYKIDDSSEWLNYNGTKIKLIQGQTIYAKGIDIYGNETRIVSSHTADVVDAMKSMVSDGNDATFTNEDNKYLLVDKSIQNNNIRVRWEGGVYSGSYKVAYLRFLDVNKNEISRVESAKGRTITDEIYHVPNGTVWIEYFGEVIGKKHGKLYEIQPSNEPTFNLTNGYMVISSDPSKIIRSPYQMITINYFPTSVQRLYKVGNSGSWLNYNNTAIKVNQNETIYAKGIDKYGNETRIVSSHTVDVLDAMKSEAFDNNTSTYTSQDETYMLVDSDMHNKNIKVTWQGGSYSGSSRVVYLIFMDASKTEIGRITSEKNKNVTTGTYTIPSGTVWIKYISELPTRNYTRGLYEIQVIK